MDLQKTRNIQEYLAWTYEFLRMIRLQRIYNFLLFHAIILSVLDV